MHGIPSVVLTRHRNHQRDKCFFVAVCVDDLSAERSFFAKKTAYAWAEWALENIEAAARQTAAAKAIGMGLEVAA